MSSICLNVNHNEKRSLITVIYNGQSEWIMFIIIITVIFVEGAQLTKAVFSGAPILVSLTVFSKLK